ncbi:hypothetical protein [Butyrivibrio sp. AC2005]|uniref:hypothetical protein n=1 Tax=Butyrivibrio sp. AC2005 TaxID=1280672 RepID=UPI0004118EF4|nr:hypothetical protein [Butyrivibrio sp. AC2005]
MEQRNRDGIIIGMLVILTYFLIYAFLGNSSIVTSLGGLPLIDCTTDIIRNGFSSGAVAQLTQDFAQTIIVIYIVVFVENLIPGNGNRGLRGFALMLLGYIFLYLFAMWVVRHIIFTSLMNDIIRMFVSIFFVVTGGLGALVASPLRRIFTERMARSYLNDYLMNSRIVRWLADAFFIATFILFLAAAIEMAVGLPYFFTAVVAGFPAIITIIIMLALLYYMIRM